MNKFAQTALEKVQIDFGIVFLNHGEVGVVKLGPTRGGATFEVIQTYRDIEFDGRRGKTKGMQILDEQNAVLKFALMDLSKANLLLGLQNLKDTAGVLTSEEIGLVDAAKYAKNITMFAKLKDGKFKKITLYNAMNEANFVLATEQKNEGAVPFEVFAHWDPITGGDAALFKIEDANTIA